jgi:hypothetical protein
MAVQHWAYPERLADAREDFSATVPTIDYFSEIFYEYPFLEEKYGHAMIPIDGAMEHQTATSYGDFAVTGEHHFDFLLAHELAHSWWGNHVGPASYESIWLNEGFATYAEALLWEHRYGRQAYRDYMQHLDILQTFGWEFSGPVYAPFDLFGVTVYNKGAWILHMLRWLLAQPTVDADPEPLLEVLRAHGGAHAYGSATSDQFVATASSYAGQDLHWFFDPWLLRGDRPDYLLSWATLPQPGGDHLLFLRVQQRQNGSPYRLPVLLRIRTASGALEQVVWQAERRTDYRVAVLEEPLDLSWDEDGWLLKRLEVERVPASDADGDGTPDFFDCAVSDNGAWMEPQGDSFLYATKQPDGRAALWFTNPDPLGQREYSTDVAVGSLQALRSSGTFGDATCLAAGHPDPSLVDTTPDISGAKYYQAWPWNGCGPTDTTGLPLSPCR